MQQLQPSLAEPAHDLDAMARSWGSLIAAGGPQVEWVRGSGAQGHSDAHTCWLESWIW